MAIIDPREYLKNLFTPILAASYDIVVMYEGGPENLKYLLYVTDYDAVITIGRQTEIESGDGKRIQDDPLRYPSRVPLKVVAIDDPTRIPRPYATELLNWIRWNLIALAEGFADKSRATITVTQSRERNMITGGYEPLWVDEYIITFRPLDDLG